MNNMTIAEKRKQVSKTRISPKHIRQTVEILRIIYGN